MAKGFDLEAWVADNCDYRQSAAVWAVLDLLMDERGSEAFLEMNQRRAIRQLAAAKREREGQGR